MQASKQARQSRQCRDEFIAFAVDGTSRMQRVIKDLLTYSRVGITGRELLDPSSEEALQQALRNLRGAIEESGAAVTHDPLRAVLADETQLIQLLPIGARESAEGAPDQASLVRGR